MVDQAIYGHLVNSPVTSTVKPNISQISSFPVHQHLENRPTIKDNTSELNAPTSPGRHSTVIFITILIVAFMIYTAIYLWRKRGRRLRRIPKLYKSDEYRYSRLNQNETETDPAIHANDPIDSATNSRTPLGISMTEEEKYKPATLHLETDSLINLSNHSSNSPVRNLINSTDLEMDLSDEDLLQ